MVVSGFICTFAPEFTPCEPCEAVKVWAKLSGTASYNALFLVFEPRKFKTVIKNIAEWMLRVGILSYPVSVPRIVGSSRTLSRGAIHKYRRRGHRTLSVNVYRFSQDLKTDGQSESSRSFCIYRSTPDHDSMRALLVHSACNSEMLLGSAEYGWQKCF